MRMSEGFLSSKQEGSPVTNDVFVQGRWGCLEHAAGRTLVFDAVDSPTVYIRLLSSKKLQRHITIVLVCRLVS